MKRHGRLSGLVSFENLLTAARRAVGKGDGALFKTAAQLGLGGIGIASPVRTSVVSRMAEAGQVRTLKRPGADSLGRVPGVKRLA